MTITRENAHWRVDHVTEERRPTIPLAWFVRRWQAEEYIQHFAGDRLNPSFSHVLVDETPRDPDDLDVDELVEGLEAVGLTPIIIGGEG